MNLIICHCWVYMGRLSILIVNIIFNIYEYKCIIYIHQIHMYGWIYSFTKQKKCCATLCVSCFLMISSINPHVVVTTQSISRASYFLIIHRVVCGDNSPHLTSIFCLIVFINFIFSLKPMHNLLSHRHNIWKTVTSMIYIRVVTRLVIYHHPSQSVLGMDWQVSYGAYHRHTFPRGSLWVMR